MKNLKKGDWVLIKAGVLGSEACIFQIYDGTSSLGSYLATDILTNEPMELHGILFDGGYAVKVPKSKNIEMLDLLYMPLRGAFDEETQN